MTGIVIVTNDAAPIGSVVEHEDTGRLTPKGRAYRVLSIDGKVPTRPTYIVGRFLALD